MKRRGVTFDGLSPESTLADTTRVKNLTLHCCPWHMSLQSALKNTVYELGTGVAELGWDGLPFRMSRSAHDVTWDVFYCCGVGYSQQGCTQQRQKACSLWTLCGYNQWEFVNDTSAFEVQTHLHCATWLQTSKFIDRFPPWSIMLNNI